VATAGAPQLRLHTRECGRLGNAYDPELALWRRQQLWSQGWLAASGAGLPTGPGPLIAQHRNGGTPRSQQLEALLVTDIMQFALKSEPTEPTAGIASSPTQGTTPALVKRCSWHRALTRQLLVRTLKPPACFHWLTLTFRLDAQGLVKSVGTKLHPSCVVLGLTSSAPKLSLDIRDYSGSGSSQRCERGVSSLGVQTSYNVAV
jgi:hypothetical protein